ncbi:type II secretion system F family protein [Desulfonatronum thioautotrophicum]|uniref:type II secretion system F family protein n=1 Tax=Desulfonatronum thioautotrophicum TaxID=617001 RepID=UPI0005EB7B6F|nr:type II secretion system F family protein [Desulfonatronum thioautotrophicum]
MPHYRYEALTDTGSRITGTIEADSEDQAKTRIAAQGNFPTSMRQTADPDAPVSVGSRTLFAAKVKPEDLILFTKQMRTMLDAGISVIALLEILQAQVENPTLRKTLVAVREDLRQGASIFAAMSRHPKVFSKLYCSMIRAGEISGTLSQVLERLIFLIDHENKVRKKIKTAMTYPVIVLVTLFGAFLFLLTFVIPQFVGVFQSANIELPLPTRICILLYDGLNTYWQLLLAGFVGLIIAVIVSYRTVPGKLFWHSLFLKIPLIGPVLQKAAMSRFASIFALLQGSGVSILDSMTILGEVIGNSAIAKEFDNLQEKLREGRGISGPLRNSTRFTPMIVSMIAVGEESGNLDEMMSVVSAHYDYEVDYAVGRMSEMITPILTLLLAGVVGFFALAIFMPMWDLTKMVR